MGWTTSVFHIICIFIFADKRNRVAILLVASKFIYCFKIVKGIDNFDGNPK